jgi:hypothetical protein
MTLQAEQLTTFMATVLARFGIGYDEQAFAVIEGMLDKPVPERAAVEAAGPRWPQLSYVCEYGMNGKCVAYTANSYMPVPPPWPERCPCDCHAPSAV